MRPINKALTFSAWPIFCGSSSFPLNLKTVLRAMTLRSGSWERVLIKLSVRPSLRYSLPGSAVAFMKGRTAMELILAASDRPRRKYTGAAAIIRNAATPATRYLRERVVGAAAGMEDEPGDDEPGDDAATEAGAEGERPESKSRFSRARSVRMSAAV